MKSKIITIAGDNVSGKSSVGKEVARMLEYKHYSAGDFARSLGTEKKMTIDQIAVEAEKDASIPYDELIDQWVRDKAKEEKFVMDSRLGFHWLPKSFKVFLEIGIDVAANRAMKDLKENLNRSNSEHYRTLKEAREYLQRRSLADRTRYREKYGIAYGDFEPYDLVINTGHSKNSIQTVSLLICNAYTDWIHK